MFGKKNKSKSYVLQNTHGEVLLLVKLQALSL